MEPSALFPKVFHAENSIFKDAVQLRLVGEVGARGHGLLYRVVELALQLPAALERVPAQGKADFLGQDEVTRPLGGGYLSRALSGVALFERGHAPFVLRVVGGVGLGFCAVLTHGGFPSALQLGQLVVKLRDLARGFLYLRLFLGAVQRLLVVLQLGTLEPQLAPLLFKGLGVFPAERETLLPVLLQGAHFLEGPRAELKLGIFVQPRLGFGYRARAYVEAHVT